MKRYKGKSLRLGGGGQFSKLVDELMKQGMTKEQAQATAAKIGREKYGDTKMQKMATVGKKRASKKKK